MAKDVDLFRNAMADVTPLKGRRKGRRVHKPAAAPVRARASRPAGDSVPSAPVRKAPAPPVVQVFDRDVARALSRGKRVPQASLDLHGMTLAAAERAVSRFLAQSAEHNLRIVLIVTGKGARLEGGRVFGGRIRAEFSDWLERPDNRSLVAGVRAAHPRHGGTGAFYVLLRRRSSASNRSLRATPQR
jgi:DNA-nicking Smr family endonuclease